LLTSLGAAGGIGAIAVGTNAVIARSTTVDGTIEAKSITGRGGEESHTVVAHDGTLNIDDPAYRDDFSNWQDVTVDETLARKFERDYLAVYYNLHVQHTSAYPNHNIESGESLAYRTDRPFFNSVQVGDSVNFEATGEDIPRIDSLK
jgi:hypothetical protein